MTQADGEKVGGAYVELFAKDNGGLEKTTTKQADKAFKEIEKSSKDTADNIAKDFEKAGEKIAKSLEKTVQRRDSKGRYLSKDAVGEAVAGAETIAKAFGNTKSALDSLLGLLGQLPGYFGKILGSGPGLAALPAVFIAIGGAAAFAARAIQDILSISYLVAAAVPGAIAGLIASFLILKAATSGVGDAFTELTKKQDKAGSSGVNNARQVADAQRGVLQAQKDLIKAKDDEIKRIRTLALEVQRARASEARAADDVLKAQYALQRARDVGTPRSQIEAALALEEANATLAEAKEKTKDLSAEKAKADKNGVSGSEQVLRAQEQLLDAQDRLAQSQQRLSAGAAAQHTAFDGLTKSAQDFVLALVEAKKQLGPVQDAIQEAFFKGTAPLLQPVVDNIKDLQPELEDVASAFGGIFKEILKFFGTKEAKDGLQSLLKGVSDALLAITPSIGPLLKAFTGLVGKSGDFGKSLGGRVAEALDKIADFVAHVDLDKVFKDAKDAIRELKPIISDVASILKSVFDILEFFGRYVLPEVARSFKIVSKGIDDFEGKVKFVKDKLTEFFDGVGRKVGLVRDSIVTTISGIPTKITALGSKFLQAGKDVIASFFKGVSSAGSFAGDFAKNLASTFITFFNKNVIGAINNAIKSIQAGFNLIPGLSIKLPQLSSIPALAQGGLSSKETIARISEGNKKEGIIPLENSRALRAIGEAISKAGGVGTENAGGGTIVFAKDSFVLNFQGALPTAVQAENIGTTIGRAAARVLERRNIGTRVRGM